jgi:hypothetical protein
MKQKDEIVNGMVREKLVIQNRDGVEDTGNRKSNMMHKTLKWVFTT